MNHPSHTITIFYTGVCTKCYLNLSTFLFLCGYVVTGRRVDICCDATGGMEMENRQPCGLTICLGEPQECLTETGICIDDNTIANRDLLSVVVDKIRGLGQISEEKHTALCQIRKIYEKYDLCHAEYAGQYYFYVREEAETVNAKCYAACSELCTLQMEVPENSEANRVYWYARGMLIRKIQILAAVNDISVPYNIPKVLDKLGSMDVWNDDEPSVYRLMGYLAETTEETYDLAGDFYLKSIKLIPDEEKSGLGEVYYRLAHWYDKKGIKESAYEYYSFSFKVDSCDYRALYRLARINQIHYREIGTAMRYYKQMADILETIRDTGYIQPAEHEYLFKAYYCMMEIAENKGNKRKENEFREKLLAIGRTSVSQMGFLKDFYGKYAGKYIQYTADRIDGFCKQV